MGEKSKRYLWDEAVIAFRSRDDGMALLDRATGDYYLLEGVAAIIWRYLDGREFNELIEEVLKHYPSVTPTELCADVQSFLADLLAARLINDVTLAESER